MKHAYLILAHQEFEVLQQLIGMLDDPNHTIYIHFDRKVRDLPDLKTVHSELIVLPERIDVRWGHISIVEAEFALWQAAYKRDDYAFFHLISGVHLPLQDKVALRGYFDPLFGKSVLSAMPTDEQEIQLKMRRYHLFVPYFHHRFRAVHWAAHYGWLAVLKLQKIFGIVQHPKTPFSKASQWLSLSPQAVHVLLKNKRQIVQKYRYTFCPDEFFVRSELLNQGLGDAIIDNQKLLKTAFINVSPKVYTLSDQNDLIPSDYLFARKFSSSHMDIVQAICNSQKNVQ